MGGEGGGGLTGLEKLTSHFSPRGKFDQSVFFPWGKNGPAHSFPGEKTD